MGCDVSAAEPRVVVETEQKFLVDREAFEQVRGLCKRVDVMQCYVATDQGDGGYEVRFRRSEGDGRTGFKCTLKRRRQASAIARDEIEFGIDHATFSAAWDSTTWRFDKDRYSGGPLGDWTVDVFTSGPLQGVAVAEMELPEGYGSVLEYLTLHTGADPLWPAWLVSAAVCMRCKGKGRHERWGDSDHDDDTQCNLCGGAGRSKIAAQNMRLHHDLTAERVNLVAAGAVEMSERLRRLLSKTAEGPAWAPSSHKHADYKKLKAVPRLTRQGVRDLGYSKRGGVL